MSLNSNRLPRLLLALGLLAGLLAGCGGGGNSGPTAPAGANLLIRMTDKPSDDVSQINVYITALTVKLTNAPVQRLTDNIGLINLLALRNSSQLLVAANVQPGSYDFVQIDLDQSRSNVVVKSTGATEPLKIASQEIKVVGGFTVMGNGQTTVTLDFKADDSLNHLGNGDWLLTPVIVMAG